MSTLGDNDSLEYDLEQLSDDEGNQVELLAADPKELKTLDQRGGTIDLIQADTERNRL